MTESRIIHWKRIAVEAAAIVISILLAFAIDAWWVEKKDRPSCRLRTGTKVHGKIWWALHPLAAEFG